MTSCVLAGPLTPHLLPQSMHDRDRVGVQVGRPPRICCARRASRAVDLSRARVRQAGQAGPPQHAAKPALVDTLRAVVGCAIWDVLRGAGEGMNFYLASVGTSSVPV